MTTYIDPASALRIARTARDEDIRRAEQYRLVREHRRAERDAARRAASNRETFTDRVAALLNRHRAVTAH